MSIKSDAIEVLTTKWDTAGYQTGSFIDLVMKIYACACSQCDYYDDTAETACSSNGMSESEIINDSQGLTDKTTSKIFSTVEGALAFAGKITAPIYRNNVYADFKSDDPTCADATFFYFMPEKYLSSTTRIQTPAPKFLDVCIANGFYVLVSSYSSVFCVSTDGDAFSEISLPSGLPTDNIFKCVFTGSKFIVVPDEKTSKIAVSTNPASGWSLSDIGDDTHTWRLAASDGNGVVVVSTPSTQYASEKAPVYRRSADHCSTWQPLVYPEGYFPFVDGLGTSYIYSLSFAANKFLALIGFAKTIIVSSDKGITWSQPVAVPFVGPMAYGDGVYVIADKDSASLAVSYDLLSWEVVDLAKYGESYIFNSIAFAGGVFVAVGSYDVLYVSRASDPLKWVCVATKEAYGVNGLGYDGSHIYLVGVDSGDNNGCWKILSSDINGSGVRIRTKRPKPVNEFQSLSNNPSTYNYINNYVAAESVDYTDSDGIPCKRFAWDAKFNFTRAMQVLSSRHEYHTAEIADTEKTFTTTVDGVFFGGAPSRLSKYNNPTSLPELASWLCAVFEFISAGAIESRFYYCLSIRGASC